ncbi:MAG: SDR family oxidoreductase [Gammaproteobacteria bacterium]
MHVLLTGATGYLGRHLLARLLGDGHRVSVLVRPRRGQLQLRVVETLRPLPLPAGRPLPEIQVLAGDVSAPACGLDAAALAGLRASPPDAFVHAAGLTRFETHLAADIARHNREGTRIAHALARDLGVPRFVHVSTAYVAGDTTLPFGADDLDVGQGFHNPYEEAKFRAEQDLRVQAGRGPAIDVIRPSIVVGGCPLGDGDAVSTVYTFIKALHFLRECARRDAARGRGRLAAQGIGISGTRCLLPLRVPAEPGHRLDLVHVDDVVEQVLATLAEPPAGWRVQQVTGPGTTLETLRQGICGALAIDGPRFVAAGEAEPRTRLEQQFDRITRVYQPYLHHAPRFRAPTAYTPRAIDVAGFSRAFLVQMGDRAGHGNGSGVGALALAVAGVREPRDYFRALVDGEIGRHFLARHDFVDLRVCFRLGGEQGGDTTVHFSRGRATLVDPASPFAADCTYVLDSELFMRIVAGQADLRGAFFAGRVRIHGDKELALKFGALLGLYYHRIEEHVLEEVAV